MFPPQISSTVFGATNIAARISSIFSSEAAEIAPPTPLIVFCVLSFIGTVLSALLKKEDAGKAQEDEEPFLEIREEPLDTHAS